MDIELDQQEDLDILYYQYLENLKNVILKLDSAEDVNYCKRWIEAFNNCSEDQKLVRNCLVSVMYQQLHHDGKLSDPFTDLSKINCNFKNIFVEDDSQEYASTRSERLNSIKFFPEGLSNRGGSRCPREFQPNFDSPSTTNRHLAQIDDLTKFIVNMRNINHLLQSELKKSRKDNSVLEMKIQRKDMEMQRLLSLNKTEIQKQHPTMNFTNTDSTPSSSIPLSNRINRIIESYDTQKKNTHTNLSIIVEGTEEDDSMHVVSTNPFIATEAINFDEILFDFLANIAKSLETYSQCVSSINDISSKAINISPFLPENFPLGEFGSRVQIYENRIQHALTKTIERITSHFTNESQKVSFGDIAIQTEIEKLQLEKFAVTKTTQTNNLDFWGTTGSESRHDALKIHLLRSCIYKLKKSHDKLAERYNSKVKEKKLQDALQKKLWKLEIAFIQSHLQMDAVCKNKIQVVEITAELESKYRSIVSDSLDELTKGCK